MLTVKQVMLRLPDDLAAAIDARVEQVDAASRNAWLVRALAWAVAQPVKTVTTQEKV